MTDFPLPPENLLSEQIALPDHRLALGLIHPDGRDLSIGAWDGETLRIVTVAKARSWADDIEAEPYAKALRPVSDALRTLARRADEITTAGMFRRAGKRAMANLAAAQAEGHA